MAKMRSSKLDEGGRRRLLGLGADSIFGSDEQCSSQEIIDAGVVRAFERFEGCGVAPAPLRASDEKLVSA